MRFTFNHAVNRLILGKLSLLLTIFTMSPANAANETLTITPDQCVALTQGQRCYVDATLTWTSPTVGNYCLYSSQQVKPLTCWQLKNSGQFSREFADDKNIIFTLKIENEAAEIATQQLKITWVHQKRGQPRMWWRIF
ncbi:DUF3019 domain-containing protein [Psychrosphaera sp. 1_MG-2023]|uniref:DUF3019 domain-containing protein n=1 Tax=Psychrosphaera algicola TaxID=3023714 RepID=A0ABT5FF50_9GAMM|nr:MULTISPECIES: DUF3019 domain-containing protein [unclassified Psychrosphaera]MDC2889236.1 DUF3019 domain-containing protein [Psychrosphaera sp. G1-22]MDO6720623.1 DUF3019 domain-containing protein [Psychrosphaera sp. 1_MG-2023]